MNTKMQTKKAKRGFTITELVIVIAVIAILAAVLIPTFSNVIQRANESAAMQEARNEWVNFSAEEDIATANAETKDYLLTSDGYYFIVEDGQFNEKALEGVKITNDTEVTWNSTYSPKYTAAVEVIPDAGAESPEEGATYVYGNKGVKIYQLTEVTKP